MSHKTTVAKPCLSNYFKLKTMSYFLYKIHLLYPELLNLQQINTFIINISKHPMRGINNIII